MNRYKLESENRKTEPQNLKYKCVNAKNYIGKISIKWVVDTLPKIKIYDHEIRPKSKKRIVKWI